MKAIIVYKSKTGFTKRYAEWIQENTSFDIVDMKNVSKSTLSEYEYVIFGGRVHAGLIDGLKKIKEMLSNNNVLIVFATGATPKEAKEQIDTVWKNNLTSEEIKTIPHFYMPSGMNYEDMGFGDKLIMKAFAKMLNKKKDKNSVEAGTEQAISHSFDISSKEYINPLLEYIKTLK